MTSKNENMKKQPPQTAEKQSASPTGLTNAQMDAISEATGAALKEEPPVNLIIPRTEGDSDTVECCINGYIYVIKKGEMVSVPRSVADVLRHANVL